MASVGSTSPPPSPLVTGVHRVANVVEPVGHGTVAVAALARAVHPLHALPTLGYAAGVSLGMLDPASRPAAASMGMHASGIAEGIVGALGVGHGAAPVGRAGHLLARSAHAFGRVLPAIVAGVGAVEAVSAVDSGGIRALAATQPGRGAVANVVGGVLLLTPHPVAKLAGAGAMAAGLANDVIG